MGPPGFALTVEYDLIASGHRADGFEALLYVDAGIFPLHDRSAEGGSFSEWEAGAFTMEDLLLWASGQLVTAAVLNSLFCCHLLFWFFREMD